MEHVPSAGICIIGRILEVLRFEPFPLILRFRDVNALDLEDDRPCAIVAASDHHPLVICPLVHDGTALQSGVHISADGIPSFSTESSVHQPIEIILFRSPFQNKGIPCFEARTSTGFRVGKIFFLILGKHLCFQDGYSTFMLHHSHLH